MSRTEPRQARKGATAGTCLAPAPLLVFFIILHLENPMSYLVLARKYRPQTFAELIGQEHVTTTLRNAITSNRIAHSYIFSGARGCGKTSAARIFAKAINCENQATMNGEPCNQCTTCKEITAGNALDVIEIDGASNRGIEEVRSLRENVKYTPAKTRFKVYIIDEVHMLTEQAFNALLKTLEEPPEHIIFIFATTEPHSLPITILSRCQRYDFHRIPTTTIARHLKEILNKEGIPFDEEAIIEISKNAGGSFRDSQTLLDQLIAFSSGKILIEDVRRVLGLVKSELYARFLDCVLEDRKADGLELLHQVNSDGHDLAGFYSGFLEFLRNIMVIQVADPSKITQLVQASDKDIEIMKAYATRVEQTTVLALMNLLADSAKEMKFSNNPLVFSEVLFFKMPDIHKGINLNALHNQLLKLRQMIQERPASPNKPAANGPLSPPTHPATDIRQVGNLLNAYSNPPPSENGEKKKAEPLNLEIIRERWREFLESPGTRKIQALRSFALCCELAEFSGNTLRLIVTMKMAYNELSKPETSELLKKELESFFGSRLELEILFKETPPPAVGLEPTRDHPDELDSTKISYEPLLKNAVKIFGGDRIK